MIVWQDSRNGNSDIYMYTISASNETQITVNESRQESPAIYEGRIVWNDGRNGNSDIYMCSAIKEETQPKMPAANFSSNTTEGYAPLSVQFNDTSTGAPTQWFWNFGDGANSTEQNTTHTYSAAGNYTVNLTVNNTNGTDSKSSYVAVSNSLSTVVAAFTASPTSGKAPLNVNFTDSSTGSPTSWKWYFGDGTNSTERNPVHIYSKAAKYTVSLTVNNPVGSNTETMSGYITVS
jgi:beta propeller repeat protein